MNKNLLAFFLASLTLSLPLMILSAISTSTKPIVRINIQSEADVSNIVSAITNIHRPDVVIKTEKRAVNGITELLVTIPFATVRFMVLSAIIGVLYKFYCKRLGVTPTI